MPLAAVYAIVYLGALHLKIRREGKIQNSAVYNVLAVDLEGRRDILGHWIGDGTEGSSFCLNGLTDLQRWGVDDIRIAGHAGTARPRPPPERGARALIIQEHDEC